MLERFNEAIDEYMLAYDNGRHPTYLFNISQAYRRLGEYREAAFHLRRYLEASPNAPNAAQARSLLEKLDARWLDAGQ